MLTRLKLGLDIEVEVVKVALVGLGESERGREGDKEMGAKDAVLEAPNDEDTRTSTIRCRKRAKHSRGVLPAVFKRFWDMKCVNGQKVD